MNVEGVQCDKCKNGTFNLHSDNIHGCSKCFCNGLTDDCRSAKIQRKQVGTAGYNKVFLGRERNVE